VKRVSALKYCSKSNSVNKHSHISVYECWQSVMIIQFRTSTQYINLTDSNIYIYIYIYIHTHTRVCVCVCNTLVRFITRSEVQTVYEVMQWKYQILASYINRDRSSLQYIRSTVEGICSRSASNGRTVSTFKVNTEQTKVSKMSIGRK